MPTGYTHEITERDVSFEEFVWTCAHGIGAFIMSRDDSFDAPLPLEYKASEYHKEGIEEAEKRIAEINKISDSALKKKLVAQQKKDKKYHESELKKAEIELERVKVIIHGIIRWVLPTKEHKGFKDFMIEQISLQEGESKNSVEYHKKALAELKEINVENYRTQELADATRDLEYHKKHWQEEQDRTKERNEWIKALVDSVPQPKKRKGK